MNGWVVLALNSLILTGRTLRTFSAVVSECLPVGLFQEASATRSPLKDDWPEVTLKVALTLAPGATGSENVDAPEATAVQPLGVLRLSLTPIADSSVLLVKVTVVGDEEPGVKLCTRGGVLTAEDGARLTVCTAYFAETTFAWISWSVASVGKVLAAVTAPS